MEGPDALLNHRLCPQRLGLSPGDRPHELSLYTLEDLER